MSRKNKTIQLSAKAFLLSMGLTLVACGGGGSPGGGGGQQPVSYSGNTNQATINPTNSEEINDSYINSKELDIGVIGITSTNLKLSENSKNLLIERLKQDVLSSVNNSNSNTTQLATSITTPSLTSGTGDCSLYGVTEVADGTSALTINSQSDTTFNLQIRYSNYCVYDTSNSSYLVINGLITANVTGSNLLGSDTSAPVIINSISMSLSNISVKYTDSTETFSATISQQYNFTFFYDASNNLTQTNFSIYTDVSYNELVYRFEIEAQQTTGGGILEIYRFYHPTYGYVKYESTLGFGCPDGSPNNGTLVITGTNTSYSIEPSGLCDGVYTITEI